MLVAVADEDEKLLSQDIELRSDGLTVNEERLRAWPPWPFPPWDPEDPDDPDHPGDGPHRPHKPVNRTKEAQKLAVKVVDFEKKLANASLDLCAVSLAKATMLADFAFIQ